MDGLDFAVRYPFSSEARAFIGDLQLNEHIVELGTERILKALNGTASAKVIYHESDKKNEIASFAAARMILGYMHNSFITNKFAVNESKVMHGYLNRDDDTTVDKIGKTFGIHTQKENERQMLGIPVYISFSPKAPHYRLINRRIFNGLVEISNDEKKRLIEEAIKKHIEKIPMVSDPPVMIQDAAKRIIDELPKHQTKIEVKDNDHPPCIMKLLESVKKHENLSHPARWFLATYLLAISMEEEAIVGIYSNLPDFNEKITRYQISHAKKKGYSVPSCATVTTYGLCCAICRIGTPIRWHQLDKSNKEALRK
ncbi:hypothetical protein KKF81_03185 [Candidatus Micrarchaeota archaeon]|nr:hypothetical protein [Candidatus Micrarchaeota archaeon]MBU1165926.1 hypothetical protein [Candidatus Micrarchaeota archaeon]MBU1887154.1 hypothetical protein [Candidatus Micrarchaeota archaeon]